MSTSIKFFVLILGVFLSTSCSFTKEDISDKYLNVDGLEIIGMENVSLSGYDEELIKDLIQNVNDAINKYYPGLNLKSLMQYYHLRVQVYPTDRMSVGGLYMRGNQTIMLSAPDGSWNSNQQCLQMYYTLGHELIHFVDYAYLNNENSEHNTKNLFFLGCSTSSEYINTSEYDIWATYADICNYNVNALYGEEL